MADDRRMTTQTGQSDYARHMRDQRGRRQWSPSRKTGRGGGNRK